MGDIAALLGGADELLDGHVRKVKLWAVRRGLGTLRTWDAEAPVGLVPWPGPSLDQTSLGAP
jgi:hypothetical protein